MSGLCHFEFAQSVICANFVNKAARDRVHSPANRFVGGLNSLSLLLTVKALSVKCHEMDFRSNYFGPMKVPIGLPVFESSPLASVLASTYKESCCECCFASITDPLPCMNCQNQWYCSEKCRAKDLHHHEPECRAQLHSKILNSFGTNALKGKISEFFLSNDDIIDFSRLFFRVIKSTKPIKQQVNDDDATNDYLFPSESFTIDNQKRTVEWDDINCPIELSEKLVEMEHADLINDYLEGYDDLDEDERKGYDEQLGLDIPSDELFMELALENEVKTVLNNTVNTVVDSLSPTNDSFDSSADDPPSFKSSQDNQDVGNTSLSASGNTNEGFYSYFLSQIKKKDVWEKMLLLSKDNRAQYLSNCFETFKIDSEKAAILRESAAEAFDEEEDEGQHMEGLESLAESLKFYFRIFRIDTLFGERLQLERKPLDGKFGFWVIQLREILDNDQVKEHYGDFEWEEIVKAFYVTLRFSIAIPDFICRYSIARAVYLPMTLISHSCVPTTSAVFDGPNMKLFYLPSNRIKVKACKGFNMPFTYDSNDDTLFDPRLASSEASASLLPYLPLKKPMVFSNLTFDFQHDLFFRMDFSTIFLYGKLRLINCFCQLCSKYSDEAQSKDYEIDDFAMDDDYALGKKSSQKLTGTPQGNRHQMTMDNYYESCLDLVDSMNAQYGNLQEEEYAIKVQVPLGELIYQYRQVLGHYNPKISILLLFLTYSNLVIIKWQRRRAQEGQQPLDYIIFYRYKQMHSYLLDAMSAFAVTHGHKDKIVLTLKAIHEAVHAKLGKLYASSKEVIEKVEQTTENWSEEIFGESSKCNKMMALHSVVNAIDRRKLINASGAEVPIVEEDDAYSKEGSNQTTPMDCDEDGAGYSCFMKRPRFDSMTDYDFCEEPDPFAEDDEIAYCQGTSKKANKARMTEKAAEEDDDILELIASICDFEEFRKL